MPYQPGIIPSRRTAHCNTPCDCLALCRSPRDQTAMTQLQIEFRLFLALFVAVNAYAQCASSKAGQQEAVADDGERLIFFPRGSKLWMV